MHETDSEEFVYSIDSEGKETVNLQGQRIKMIVDTGSGKTLISEQLYKKIFAQKGITLSQTSKRFYAYGQKVPLKCVGSFDACLKYKLYRTIKATVYVIEGAVEPLLGRKAYFKLEVLQASSVNYVDNSPDRFSKLAKEYESLFKGSHSG